MICPKHGEQAEVTSKSGPINKCPVCYQERLEAFEKIKKQEEEALLRKFFWRQLAHAWWRRFSGHMLYVRSDDDVPVLAACYCGKVFWSKTKPPDESEGPAV